MPSPLSRCYRPVNILVTKRWLIFLENQLSGFRFVYRTTFLASNSIRRRYFADHTSENRTNRYNLPRNGKSGCHGPPKGVGKSNDSNMQDYSRDSLRSRIQIMGSISQTETNREFFTDACLPARVEPPIKPIVTKRGNTLFTLIRSC